MRFKEFVTEDTLPHPAGTAITAESVAKMLQDCSDYFGSFPSNGALTYTMKRGDKHAGILKMKDTMQPVNRDVSGGRVPKDMSPIMHKELNNVFTTLFGHPFRDSMMCSGAESQASRYGEVGIVVPCNGYDLCYSKMIMDMYSEFDTSAISDAALDAEDTPAAIPKLRTLIRMKMAQSGYVSGPEHAYDAIQSNNEIMLYPGAGSSLSYYLFSPALWSSTIIPIIDSLMDGR